MNKNELYQMFKDEVGSKIDAETMKKLECAKTKKEALSILESVSVELSDDMLAAISGGADEDGIWCWTHCFGHDCPSYIYTTT